MTIGLAASAVAGEEVEHPDDHPHNYFAGNAQDCEDPDFLVNAALAGLPAPGETLIDVDPGDDANNGIVTGDVYGGENQFLDVEQLDDSYTITAIVVKGGPAYTIYVVEGIESPWTELHSPPLDSGNFPGISHWFVCGFQDDEPTEPPTEPPTDEPTEPPTDEPTEPPTDEPTEPPTDEPTAPPTDEPSETPSPSPSPDEPELPDTGSSPAVMIAAAAVLLLAGAVALRNRFVKE